MLDTTILGVYNQVHSKGVKNVKKQPLFEKLIHPTPERARTHIASVGIGEIVLLSIDYNIASSNGERIRLWQRKKKYPE